MCPQVCRAAFSKRLHCGSIPNHCSHVMLQGSRILGTDGISSSSNLKASRLASHNVINHKGVPLFSDARFALRDLALPPILSRHIYERLRSFGRPSGPRIARCNADRQVSDSDFWQMGFWKFSTLFSPVNFHCQCWSGSPFFPQDHSNLTQGDSPLYFVF